MRGTGHFLIHIQDLTLISMYLYADLKNEKCIKVIRIFRILFLLCVQKEIEEQKSDIP